MDKKLVEDADVVMMVRVMLSVDGHDHRRLGRSIVARSWLCLYCQHSSAEETFSGRFRSRIATDS